MRTSESIKALSADLVKAQVDLKNAAFDKTNPHFKNRYATLSSVRDTVVPALAKHNLAVVQATIPNHGEVWAITTRLIHTSGEWIESIYPLPLDKPQQMGSALTYGRRYSLAAICGIASEEDDDAEATKEETKAPVTMGPVHMPTKSGTREDKDNLCLELRQFDSVKMLKMWADRPDILSRIRGLHPDHEQVVRDAYVEHMNELKGRLAA